jgi:hypothetical protein
LGWGKAEEWCRKTEKRVGASIYYYETSASAATNVEEAFHALASATLYRYQVRDKSVYVRHSLPSL